MPKNDCPNLATCSCWKSSRLYRWERLLIAKLQKCRWFKYFIQIFHFFFWKNLSYFVNLIAISLINCSVSLINKQFFCKFLQSSVRIRFPCRLCCRYLHNQFSSFQSNTSEGFDCSFISFKCIRNVDWTEKHTTRVTFQSVHILIFISSTHSSRQDWVVAKCARPQGATIINGLVPRRMRRKINSLILFLPQQSREVFSQEDPPHWYRWVKKQHTNPIHILSNIIFFQEVLVTLSEKIELSTCRFMQANSSRVWQSTAQLQKNKYFSVELIIFCKASSKATAFVVVTVHKSSNVEKFPQTSMR